MISRVVSEAQPNWVKWLTGGAAGDIDIDNDGVMPTTRFLVDISQALSQRLGRQMSHNMVYVVDYVHIQLLNVDDVADNNAGANFSGRCDYWVPTKHRIDAMKLARKAEKATEDFQVDADSFFLSTEQDYSGLRFNWDGDGQVIYATAEGLGGTGLSASEWNLADLFSVYNNNLTQPTQTNAMWATDGRTGYPNNFGWTVSYMNNVGGSTTSHHPISTPFVLERAGLEVLAGLMHFEITHSSTDAPTAVDDDYQVYITLGISGWREI